ncbi:CRAL/TRIO domain-containing protein [Gymnopus androsaceus JB14]|uniref:CRAL/TRIO domain-containing protein n=1 Tax=Gymnopus androsaceus JB14 TaxID=1447944 RepID=A0A6A4HB78_9AGAR|nr:CRAL/TRIO domain-containing protein [Gymnopus androsaceus JB14]
MSSFFFGSSKKESSTVSEKPAGTTKSTFSTKSTKSSKSVSSLAETDVVPNPTTTKIQTEPAPGTKIGPIHEYDEKQTEMMKQVKEYALSISLPPSDPYAKWERRWLNKPDTIPRYSRASKWNLNDAKKRMKGTMEWRREFKPELITPDEVKIEDESGKILVNGFDNDGRPIIYMRPGRQNTETSPRQLRHLVWCLERAKDLMPPGQESVVIIVDYKTTTLRTNPSVSVASKVLTILQHHYVETLGRAIVTNLPLLLSFFYKGISPFLDPVTRDKMRFNPDLLELIPASQLEAEFGGEYEYEFDHESYWQQIIETCGIAPDGTRINEVVPELDSEGAEVPGTTVAELVSITSEEEEEGESISSTPATVVEPSALTTPAADDVAKKDGGDVDIGVSAGRAQYMSMSTSRSELLGFG